MLFRQLFDSDSSSYSYLLADLTTRAALIIDPVLEQVDRDIELLEQLGLELRWTLETHVHADHVTGSGQLRRRLGSRIAVSEASRVVGADRLLEAHSIVTLGAVEVEARPTPGHTPGCTTFVVRPPGEAPMAFTGDALLIRATGRTDFQGGDAATLWHSVHREIFGLPDQTRVFPAHDYRGRTMSTVGEEKRHNSRLRVGISAPEFVDSMKKLKLARPTKLVYAVPLNLRCGDEPDRWHPRLSEDGVPELSPKWVRAASSAVRLVDVRLPGETASEYAPLDGAELVPLDDLLTVAETWPDRDAAIVVICRSGVRSARATQLLAGLGFTRVASMRGGMAAWHASQPPVPAASCG